MRTIHMPGSRKCSGRIVCPVRFLYGFLLLSLVTIISCGVQSGDGNSSPIKGTATQAENSESVVESSTKTGNGETDQNVERGTSDRIGPDVATSGPTVSPEQGKSDPAETPPEQLQGLPDLSLLQDPEFQRRAKLGHLVAKRRCILCHKIDGRGAVLQPPMIEVSVRRLERMKQFSDHLEKMQQEDPNRYEARKDLFLAIEKEPDLLRKMSQWLHGYLKQPTFDNAQAKMPLQVLKPEEIDQLASYVIQLAIEGVRTGVKPPE